MTRFQRAFAFGLFGVTAAGSALLLVTFGQSLSRFQQHRAAAVRCILVLHSDGNSLIHHTGSAIVQAMIQESRKAEAERVPVAGGGDRP
eukprot:SAG31_NODE_1133_length_9745_cov_5.676343_10_plen_89_part_00